MIWANLKRNRCAQCGKDLTKTMVNAGKGMVGCSCGFRISSAKFNEIVTDRVTRVLEGREIDQDDTMDGL